MKDTGSSKAKTLKRFNPKTWPQSFAYFREYERDHLQQSARYILTALADAEYALHQHPLTGEPTVMARMAFECLSPERLDEGTDQIDAAFAKIPQDREGEPIALQWAFKKESNKATIVWAIFHGTSDPEEAKALIQWHRRQLETEVRRAIYPETGHSLQ